MNDEVAELYHKSKAAYEATRLNKKRALLSPRVLNILKREGCMVNGEIHLVEVKQLVESGAIWAVRGLGNVSIRKICEWIIEQETSID